MYGNGVRMNYAVSTLYYRVLQISRSPGWSDGGGKRAEVINSDECCIIEELRGRAFNGKGRGGGTSCVERAQREKRGKGGEMFATVVRNALAFPCFPSNNSSE